jgi:hypothetical protein
MDSRKSYLIKIFISYLVLALTSFASVAGFIIREQYFSKLSKEEEKIAKFKSSNLLLKIYKTESLN